MGPRCLRALYRLLRGHHLAPLPRSLPYSERRGGAWGYETDPSGLLQLGARWYWPEVGRFLQQDPIRAGKNSYGYAGNNPLRRTDPAGLYFRVVGDLKAFNQALDYLWWADWQTATMIGQLRYSPTEYVITTNDICGNRGFPGYGANWDPHAALWTPTGGLVSPALTLLHELAHMAEAPDVVAANLSVPDEQFENLEERRVIGIQNYAAMWLGEDQREDHGGTYFPVPTPLSRERTYLDAFLFSLW